MCFLRLTRPRTFSFRPPSPHWHLSTGMARYMFPRLDTLDGQLHIMRSLRGGKSYSLAPEVFRRGPYLARPADVWSLGTILFPLLTGDRMFQRAHISDQTNYRWVVQGRIPEMLKSLGYPYDQISDGAIDLLKRILIPDCPLMRLTVDEILEHPWVLGIENVQGIMENYIKYAATLQTKRFHEATLGSHPGLPAEKNVLQLKISQAEHALKSLRENYRICAERAIILQRQKTTQQKNESHSDVVVDQLSSEVQRTSL